MVAALRLRCLALSVVSVLVGLSGVLVLPAGAAGAAVGDGSDVSVERYGGADRYATSLLVAEAVAAQAGGSLGSVVLVSGERWTDAVVAAPIAGASGAPVLMTPPGELRADALAFLQRVGVGDAVVVGPDGGGGAHGPGRGVGAEVLDALEDAGIDAERVTGTDRYSTSVAAAREVAAGEMPGMGRTAIIASGEVFADALVAGPFAARGVHPVLLSAPDELPASVASYLADAGIAHVVVMGGTAALSADVESAITALGAKVTRLAGATRYDTAVKAAELVNDRYSAAAGQTCFDTAAIGLARARVPFDAFSAAPLLSRLCAPLVLADPAEIPYDTLTFLNAAREAHDAFGLRVFGGDAAVSQDAIDTYLDCAQSITGDPPYPGTVWVTPDILGPADPSSLGRVTYSGRGTRDIFDRRVNAWTTVNAYLFKVRFGDQVVEFQLNPEFGSEEAARAQVDTFAPAIGRLPHVLVSGLREVEINAGKGLFGGNPWNRSILVHTDDPATQHALRRGSLEEAFLHEGAHAALDPLAPKAGWRAAQRADGAFVSEYARDFPDREDIAETFLPYYAVRQQPDRLTALQRCIMSTATPNRFAFFDEQQFDLSSGSRRTNGTGVEDTATAQGLTLKGTVDHGWADPLTSGLDVAMAADIEGAVVEIIDGPDTGLQTVTDERGRWTLHGLERAQVTVRVTAKGFAPAERTLDLTADAELPIAISRQLPSPGTPAEFPDTDPDFIEAVAARYPHVHRVGNVRVFSDISPEFSREHAEHAWKVWAFFDDLYAANRGDLLDAYYTTDRDVFLMLGSHCGADAYAAAALAKNTRLVATCYQDYPRWFVVPYRVPDLGTQLHEFGHDFLFAVWPAWDDYQWFIEGTAMYFEGGVFSKTLRVPGPISYCSNGFDWWDQQNRLIPLERLLRLDRAAFLADPHHTYPLSCMLFHYLEQHRPGVLYSMIEQINSRQIRSGERLIDVMLELTGMSVAELEAAYVSYARTSS